MVTVGLAYLFGWGPVVDHQAQWTTGGDLWGIFRAAHYVGWGFVGGIYGPSTGVNTFPGMSVLLAPVALVSGALGFSESSPTVLLFHPAAALLLQPIELLLACTVLFAANSVAVVIGVGKSLRFWLIGTVAVIAWPVAALWGHAEDVLAVTFGLIAIRLLLTGRSRKSGWLMGIAIVLQPLAGFLLPIGIGMSAAGRRVRFVAQAVLPSAALIGIALAGNWSGTYGALTKQPGLPALNHGTPWLSLAPRIGTASFPTAPTGFQIGHLPGHVQPIVSAANANAFVYVSAGPVRIVGLVLAMLVGCFVWRRRPDAIGILWLCGLALAMRCYFESVMTPYYLAPPLIVALIAAARMGGRRFAIAAVSGLFCTVFSYWDYSPWVWWLPVVGMLTAVLACGYPGRRHLVANGIIESRKPEDDVECAQTARAGATGSYQLLPSARTSVGANLRAESDIGSDRPLPEASASSPWSIGRLERSSNSEYLPK
ncbi:MAG TPA: hypothetical protein VHU85_00950 [Acidimicrobiales bacterium]|nr:hypothetical protein [Acidimicrobiales bacterium]